MMVKRKNSREHAKFEKAQGSGIALLALVSYLTVANVNASDLYVDAATGADVTACQSAVAPCETIGYAIGQTAPGDTINLISTTGMAVSYKESGLTISHDLIISGLSNSKSIIDALGLDRAFNIIAGDVEMRNVTIQNGDAGFQPGGGIYVLGGSLSVRRSTLLDNTGVSGGAIAAGGVAGEVLVLESKVMRNTSTNGGGIWCDACDGVKVVYSDISGNSSIEHGGGIYTKGSSLTVLKTTMNSNISDSSGGALYIYDSSGEIFRSDFSDNEVSGKGGGAVFLYDGVLNVRRTTMANNSAPSGMGGAIHVTQAATLIASNSTFSNNLAEHAGALYLDQSVFEPLVAPSVMIASSSFYNNIDNAGQNYHIAGGWTHFGMHNTIVTYDPTIVAAAPACSAGMTSGEHNMIDDASCDGPPPTFNLGAATDVNVNLAFHGGPTRTHKLNEGSNAIDAGLNSSCINPATGAILAHDQRGELRHIDGNFDGIGTCDVGAFEVR